ncbi:uncharacterized protein PpBr36_10749 [Pyricularia pennisetigena]|uniref:uncharacterized protein n=1 Tax=Pyricularia pennisetigena TaxID=1578925 RepID=UPI00114D9A8E|nr:uncharacterized protein PpBr36_10749 [Pyricularia pennisetigena]TLS21017.1 hypothetical protein PpBr36_10749 [Pyricularia pennisetigena]
MQLLKIYLLAFCVTSAPRLFSQEENLHKIKNGKIPENTRDSRGKRLEYDPHGTHCLVRRNLIPEKQYWTVF